MSAAEPAGGSVPEPQSLDAGTEYIVLVRIKSNDETTSAPGDWKQIGKANARSSEAALRIAVERLPESERKGTFVAIPRRSWNPVSVSEKVERTLVIGQ